MRYDRIEKSFFRIGEYIGYTPRGTVRIRRSRIGWEVYSAVAGCAAYAGFRRKTLRELNEVLAHEPINPLDDLTRP